MRAILTLIAHDLRQRLKDGSVIIFGIIVPMALISVMNLIFSGVADVELSPVTVAVAAEQDDELAQVFATVLADVDVEGMQVTVQEAPPEQVDGLVRDGEVGLGVIIPEGFSAALTTGSAVELSVVRGDEMGLEADVITSIVDGVLAQMHAGSQTATAAFILGMPPQELEEIASSISAAGPAITWEQGRTADFQLSTGANVIAGQAGMFLLFTVGFGVLSLSIERATGTLARLHSMPIWTPSVVVAKAIVSFLLGLVSTGVLLGFGALVFDGVDFGAPWKVGLLVALVVIATTSLMFLVVKVAKTAEQASIAQSILAISLGMAGGAFFPVPTSGVLGAVLSLNPIAAFTRGLGITSGGGSLADLGGPILILVGFTVVVMVVGRVVPDREEAL